MPEVDAADVESETSDIDQNEDKKSAEKTEVVQGSVRARYEESKGPDSSRGGAKSASKPPILKLQKNELISRHEMAL